MPEDLQPVRPLDTGEAAPSHNPPPRMLLVVGLLAVGALLGWSIASLGGDSVATVSSPGDDLSMDTDPDPGGIPSIIWQQAESVPVIPSGLQYAGATDPVELAGTIYTVVSFFDPATDRTTGQLWSSNDGKSWRAEQLDLGEPAQVVEVTALRDGLMLSAQTDDGFGVWRSPLGRAVDGASWTRLPLDLPENVVVRFHQTAVSAGGDITTVVIANFEIWREILAPYVPANIDIEDPELVLFMGSVVRPGEEAFPHQIFSFDPEVLTTRDSVWVRVVDIDGREELFTRPLPEGAYPLARAPELGSVSVAFAWRSADGIEFSPIIGRGALPEGYFLPEPWQAGFIAAAYEQADSFALDEQVRLWSSASGRAWQPLSSQPPRDCALYFLAVSGNRLLLSDGDTRCLWNGDEWAVLRDEVDVFEVTGGTAGFLGYPRNFDSTTAMFSRDGRSWVDAALPAGATFQTMWVLDERLLAVSVTPQGSGEPLGVDIWLGSIE